MKLILAFWIFTIVKIQAQAIYQEDIFRKNDLSSTENRIEAVYYSVKKVAAQVATEFGLDHERYFAILEKNFQKDFIESKQLWLKNSTGFKDDSQLSGELLENLEAPLAHFETFERIKHSRLLEMVNRSTFLSEQKNGEETQARIELDVDKESIRNEIEEVIQNEKRKLSDVLILGRLNLHGLDWSIIGTGTEGQFIAPILLAWKKKIQEKKLNQVSRVDICRHYCLAYYRSWLIQNPDHNKTYDIRFSQSSFLRFEGDLFGRVDLKSNELIISGRGRLVMSEVSSKRNLAVSDFVLPEIRLNLLDKQSLSSILATAIYQSGPLNSTGMVSALNDPQTKNRVSQFSIKGFDRLDDVLTLMSELKKQSKVKRLELKLVSFSRDEATVLVYYSGVEKMFSDLFQRLKGVKLSQSYKIIYEFDGIHHVLRLVKN